MSLDAIRKIMQDTHARLVREGVPDSESLPALMRVEAELVQAELARMRDFRDLVRAVGSRAAGERYGITPRAIRKRLTRVLAEIGTRMAA